MTRTIPASLVNHYSWLPFALNIVFVPTPPQDNIEKVDDECLSAFYRRDLDDAIYQWNSDSDADCCFACDQRYPRGRPYLGLTNPRPQSK